MLEEVNKFHERLAPFARFTIALGLYLFALLVQFWPIPLNAGLANIVFLPWSGAKLFCVTLRHEVPKLNMDY